MGELGTGEKNEEENEGWGTEKEDRKRRMRGEEWGTGNWERRTEGRGGLGRKKKEGWKEGGKEEDEGTRV